MLWLPLFSSNGNICVLFFFRGFFFLLRSSLTTLVLLGITHSLLDPWIPWKFCRCMGTLQIFLAVFKILEFNIKLLFWKIGLSELCDLYSQTSLSTEMEAQPARIGIAYSFWGSLSWTVSSLLLAWLRNVVVGYFKKGEIGPLWAILGIDQYVYY